MCKDALGVTDEGSVSREASTAVLWLSHFFSLGNLFFTSVKREVVRVPGETTIIEVQGE